MLKKSLFFLSLIFSANGLLSQTSVAETDFSVLKNYEIIAFGEASHGSKSDYLAREELIADLIQHTDSLDVFVEMQFYVGIAIEHYAKGLIDTTALLEELGYSCPDGLMHLINRFKEDKRITFYGIDMQTHLSTLKFLKENLIANIPLMKEKIMLITDSLNYNFHDYGQGRYKKYSGIIHRCLKELDVIINSNDAVLGSKFMEVHFPFSIIQQHISSLDGYNNRTEKQPFYYNHFRDSCMAENVCSLKAFSKKQIVLLAANGHVDKAGTDNGRWVYMGGRLNRKFHNKYFVIGSQYVEGTLLEVDVTDGVTNIVVNPIHPITRTLPYDLNKLLQPKNDTLIVISEATGKLNKILNKKSYYQSFGSGRSTKKKNRHSYTIGIPSELYDAIYLIPKVEASTDISERKE